MTHKTGAGFEMESIIITTKPNESASPVHDRMPLII
nr:SOS response-associated peptidase [Enterococcus mundtii]